MPTILSLRSWVRNSRRWPRKALARSRPQVEALEPRDMPTTIAVGANVNTGHMAGSQATESIAIDPANPKLLFAAANDYTATSTSAGLYAARSTDGGRTWTSRKIAQGGPDGLPTAFRLPALAWDSFGNLFLTCINSDASNYTVALSTDGGATFRVLATLPVFDQPHIAVGAGEVAIEASVSSGNSFNVQVSSARVTGLGAVGNFTTVVVPNSDQGDKGGIAVTPGGKIVVTFQSIQATAGPVAIMVSTDPTGVGGAFNNPVVAGSSNVGAPQSIPADSVDGIFAAPKLAADLSTGPHRGRLYLVYGDAAAIMSNDTNIVVRHSDDNGKTWSAALRVNDDRTANSQFFPNIAVDNKTGFLAIDWYDCRNSPTNVQTQLFAAVSTNGGASFLPNVRVSTGSSDTTLNNHNNGNDYGDYIGLTAYNNAIFPCWADNGTTLPGNTDRPNFDVATAQVTVTGTPPPGPGSGVPKIFYPLRYVYDPRTQTYSGTLTLMNVGTGPLTGPATFIFRALPPGVTLVNATGRLNGFPIIETFFAPLAPKQLVRVPMVFSNPFRASLGNFFRSFPIDLILG
jgi:hypothetical protein